ncbi:LLM class flavin-dependent oxidoreductase [Arthrobacter sp. MMS24-S77]
MTPRQSIVPLSVLDLSPVPSGQTSADALRNTIDLAIETERLGYRRFWLAEHHLNPGVAGAAPHVLSGLVAAATSRIRVGTAATILGNYRPIQVAENVGTLAGLYPGRIDLGFGRSGTPNPGQQTAQPSSGSGLSRRVDGLLIPTARPLFHGRLADRFKVQTELLGRKDGDAETFEQDVQDVIGFFTGSYRTRDAEPITVSPAAGESPEFWIHGSTAGPSARLAGKLGLPFGANYHVSPSGVLEAISEYRSHFKASETLEEPYVIVSADVVVATGESEASSLAQGYAAWVHSIRSGAGAITYPTPEEALDLRLGADDLELVSDRLETRFVGNPRQVAGSLRTLQRVTGADELLITTITHSHAQRVRSYALLAEAWEPAHAM